jgi:SAM-dependent methyltransferase
LLGPVQARSRRYAAALGSTDAVGNGESLEDAVKLTGERPMEGATPDSLLALHDAGYREVCERLGPGVVLDVGCGIGSETERLAGANRLVIGADHSSDTVRLATRTYGSESGGSESGGSERRGSTGTASAGLDFIASDGAALGLRDRSVDFAISSHIIEHFVNPALHVIELARVLRTDGTAFVITPNAPADFENPFHVYLFEPEHLVSMLSLFFEEVTCYGLEGDDVLKADFATRRASGERLLRIDPLNLRRHIPHGAYVWAYEHVLPLTYRFLNRTSTGIGSGIDSSHFFMQKEVHADTPVLFAVARGPRQPKTPKPRASGMSAMREIT